MKINVIELVYLIAGIICALFSASYVFSALKENKERAFALGLLIFVLFCTLWFGFYLIVPVPSIVLIGMVAIVLLMVIVLTAPFDVRKLSISKNPINKIDERDVLFSREEYAQGSEKYLYYYSKNPERREIDDNIRSLPELLEPGGIYFDANLAGEIKDLFEETRKMTSKVDGEYKETGKYFSPAQNAEMIKKTAINLGADDVGIAMLNPMFLYSHVGRGPEKWGSEIKNNHKFAVVFALEMDYRSVDNAPLMEITLETARKYKKGAQIAISLAKHIRSLGYPARAHISGSNYQLILPPVAFDAGLGEVGRMGYLISRKYGARVRLGAVTSDIPLIPDSPKSLGVEAFCEKCGKCTINCPSGAIPSGPKIEFNGVFKWKLDEEKCLKYWRGIGTDCGICMKVCPYSHPSNFIHNVARTAVKNSSIARYLGVLADDLFYGKRSG